MFEIFFVNMGLDSLDSFKTEALSALFSKHRISSDVVIFVLCQKKFLAVFTKLLIFNITIRCVFIFLLDSLN